MAIITLKTYYACGLVDGDLVVRSGTLELRTGEMTGHTFAYLPALLQPKTVAEREFRDLTRLSSYPGSGVPLSGLPDNCVAETPAGAVELYIMAINGRIQEREHALVGLRQRLTQAVAMLRGVRATEETQP